MGAIAAGLGLGGIGQKIIINYTKSKYDAKISELQSYISKLEAHQNNMMGYQNRLRSVWNDSEADKYQRSLEKQLKAIKNATNRAVSLKTIYEQVSEELARQKSAGSEVLDGVNAALDALGIGDE